MSDLKNFDKNQQKPDLAKHDASILDLAFVMDCTGSMSSYIKNATDVIKFILIGHLLLVLKKIQFYLIK